MSFVAPNINGKRSVPTQVDIFEDSCYLFLREEVSGYLDADERCQQESRDFHLLDHLSELSTEYVTSRLDHRIRSDGLGQVMAWVGAQRSPDSRQGREIWNWISDGSEVDTIEWGRGQPNHYNQARLTECWNLAL